MGLLKTRRTIVTGLVDHSFDFWTFHIGFEVHLCQEAPLKSLRAELLLNLFDTSSPIALPPPGLACKSTWIFAGLDGVGGITFALLTWHSERSASFRSRLFAIARGLIGITRRHYS